MRLLIRAVTAGDEVGRQIVEDRDLQAAVSNLTYTSLGAYRDDHNRLEPFEELLISIAPYCGPTASARGVADAEIHAAPAA